MKTRTDIKLNDEIKRLNRLIKKNKADKRNEVRQNKVRVLKELKKLNNKLKSKQLKPRQYSIQYKDLSKKLKSYKAKRIKITKDDIDDRIEKYGDIFNWKNEFSRGIIAALAYSGKLDDILGFEVAPYLESGNNWNSIVEKLQTEYADEMYKLLDEYFGTTNLSIKDISKILEAETYKTNLKELWYADKNTPFFDISHFETNLKELIEQVKNENEKI